MHVKNLLSLLVIATLFACNKDKKDAPFFVDEDPSTFTELGTGLNIGVVPAKPGAAEISAYDPITKRLFTVSNLEGDVNKIVVIDFADPANLKKITEISVVAYGAVNSIAIYNGKLAAAIEAPVKQNDGKVVVFNTSDYSVVKVIPVGALPDMVTFSPDGAFILTANEGEPNADYTNDPTGTVSIISVNDNYSVVNLDFSSFAAQSTTLAAKGLRIGGLNTTFAKDMEPEYVTVAPDSKTAWVTLQENNAIAKINLTTKTITDLFPLGFKDYNTDANMMDLSDQDGGFAPKKNKVKGVYMPDAIAVVMSGNIPHLFTVNEGDAREYAAYTDVKRLSSNDVKLDPTVFPDAANLKLPAQLGRLNILYRDGDINGDGFLDVIYSMGARSFSVWNGNTGAQIYDSKNELDAKVNTSGVVVYEDGRSDDKSIEPEGITIGVVGKKTVAFVGMERVDAVAMYDITNPAAPVYLSIVKTGDAPEGVLFISAKDSPIKKSLLVVSSEDDGFIKVYKPNSL
ncbi:alkaline phosphatase [Chitinophaga sp. SYP-B3965]|uniref:choice-of-anchor I family protein n=1 Tax=Chitinophaga sp. SYP-B3965 TaxID=2663120 RepID=UPI001299DC8E|nr:choice-of-anchor I family protein [Chitinophaga sp. SYP-B3965]MRG47510.1 alkaline phosphatase [Chitinophaga sp. SYP-B3965]